MKFARCSLAAFGVLALAGPAMAQQQPPPSSPYGDGTGNSAVGTLNSGQLNQNYTGPWHRVPPDRPVAGPIRAMAMPDTGQPPPAPPSAQPTGVAPEPAPRP